MAEFDLVPDLVHGTHPKETKSPEGDSHDHDPTTVARAIEHGRADTLGAHGALHLQRAAGNAAMGALVQRTEDEAPVRTAMSSSSGSPLSNGMKEKMEASFGVDFSGVKVHTDSHAQSAAQSVQAKAFTTGQDIYFNKGQDPSDEHTMAHELTHVIQQSQGPVDGTSNGQGVSVSDPSDRFEQQAEQTAHAVTSGGTATAAGGGGSVQTSKLQRLEEADLQRLPVQRAAEEDELQTMPLQREAAEEEELQQMPLQREAAEEEELQTMSLQRQAEEEGTEEEVQQMPLQREAESEELQGEEG